MNQVVREGIALVMGVLAVGALASVMGVLAADGDWGLVALLGGAVALGGGARWLGRYDPERIEVRPRRVRMPELRNRTPSG